METTFYNLYTNDENVCMELFSKERALQSVQRLALEADNK